MPFLIVAGVNCLLSKTLNHFCVWTGLFWHDYSRGLQSFSTWDARAAGKRMPWGCESGRRIDAALKPKYAISVGQHDSSGLECVKSLCCAYFQKFAVRWERIHELHVDPGVSDLRCPRGSRFHGNPPLTRSPSRCWLWIPARSERERLVCALGDIDKANCTGLTRPKLLLHV